MDRETAKRVIEIEQCSDRVMLVKLKADPVDIVLVQICMPTTDHDNEEIEEMYEKLEEILNTQKGTDYMVIMGDMNAVVGEGRDGQEIGKFGLGQRNERGERLVEFCKRNRMVVTNTWGLSRRKEEDTHGRN